MRRRRLLAGRVEAKLRTVQKFSPSRALPRAGWEEWYIFVDRTDLGTSHLEKNIFEVPEEQGQLRVFVNYCFALHLPEMKNLAALFWKQMEQIRPESYVADNDFLTFVSANKGLFAAVRDAAKSAVRPT
jgi:hypothetical protein